MSTEKALIPVERIEKVIMQIRGPKVIIDAALARIYGVTTKKLNQAFKQNMHRFPSDFLFKLTQKEKDEVVTICDHLALSLGLPFGVSEKSGKGILVTFGICWRI